jgi:hypothetical protein
MVLGPDEMFVSANRRFVVVGIANASMINAGYTDKLEYFRYAADAVEFVVSTALPVTAVVSAA